MPIAIVVRLVAQNESRLPFLGPAAGSWVAERLGVGLEVSSGFGVAVLAPDRPGPISLRLGVVKDELVTALDRALPEPGEVIDLGGQPFVVDAVTDDPAIHPLAGRVEWNDLAGPLIAGQVPAAANRPSFQFWTPTLFDRGYGPALPLPLPDLVFGSLLDRWNAFAPTILPDAIREFAAECLALDDFRISSRWERVGAITRVGAVGRVRYTVIRRDPYYQAPLAALTWFARYAGVGDWVQQGFGLTDVAPG